MLVVIRQATRDCDYHFMGWEFARKKFDIHDYKVVYVCDRPDNTKLGDIFYEFNMAHPSDYKGYSLSVSDLVQTDNKLFYCDDCGWKDITDKVDLGF